MRRVLRALLCALPLLAAGCGDATGSGDPDLTRVTFAPALGVDISTMTRVGDGVYIKDIVVGPGADVSPNKSIGVRYRGWLPDGSEFDNNYSAAAPYSLVLAQASVIAGWKQGIPGMKVGGKRLLVIPPSLGYGSQGRGPIPPNGVMVFQVEVVSQSN
jgi:FKBP-type peptidyl-prolyl cis-trans isomerase